MPDPLDRVLAALANPHRRAIVHSLGQQPHAIHQLAAMRELSLPAIHKHVEVLGSAGLVHRHKRGRTTFLTLERKALHQLQDWVGQFHPYWGSDEATYENYERYLGVAPPSDTVTDEGQETGS
ncbi:ArsR/SmtB family transcription factor [Pseudonocardia pini]|uniref:ArsR/SmtB family transcription factor n=1 Tax=Pseudonocardia pini TaxID=2758030 RepID=UPI0015F006C1|nr:metalloregulator ArsR/SmtB family transcription factor [Pseudonocardia pini]